MKIHIGRLVPTKTELLFCAFLTAVIALLSNSSLLLSTLGLTSAAASIRSGASETISEGLTKLDSYELTNTIVTFAVWALIGLFTLSIIQAVGHVIYEFNEENRLSSNAYVHPKNFSRKGFWHEVFMTTLGTFLVAVIAVGYIFIFCIYLLPISALYIGAYISNFQTSELPYALLGLAILFVSIVGLNICARLIRFRHQLVTR